MSLVKRPTMTPARKAAQRANSRRSRGAVTPEGLERLRSARLLHGFYSEKADEALPALGDDPEGLAALHAKLQQDWNPRNAVENEWVERLARVTWQMERAERLKEDEMVRLVRDLPKGGDLKAMENRMELLWRMEHSNFKEMLGIIDLLDQLKKVPPGAD